MVDTNAFGGRTFGGTIKSINPKVDTATRNVQIEASVDNRERKLLPGMYANVKIDAGGEQRYLTLPANGDHLQPVRRDRVPREAGRADKRAERTRNRMRNRTDSRTPKARRCRPRNRCSSRPGPTRGDQVAILKGVEAGMQVVTSGQLKLKNGTPLVIDNRVQAFGQSEPAASGNNKGATR